MKKNFKLFFGICATGAILVCLLLARNNTNAIDSPSIISYQGKLLESGASVTTSKAIAFLLYNASSDGTLLYTAAGTLSSTSTISKTPENGIFTVQLGGAGTNTLDPYIFQNSASVYLEIWVAGTKLTPRKQLTTSPYSFNSQYLMGVSATTTSSSVYIPISDSYGNFTFTGTASTTGVNGGIIYINPSSASADKTLFGVADNGTERLRLDKEGDLWINGMLNVSSTLNVVATSTLATTTITNLNVDGGTLYVDNINNRVGINSSTPLYDLSVNGMSYFTGTSTMANYLDVEGKVGNPVHKGYLSGDSTLESPNSVYVSGNYAYIATTAGGVGVTDGSLTIIDISDPANPVRKSYLGNGTGGALLVQPMSVYVSGNYAYVASANSDALEIIDISNPVVPVHKGSLTNGTGGALLSSPYSVYVSGNYAYVASKSSDALEIIDISNPANPVHKGSLLDGVGSAPYLNGAYSVYVSGKYAYIVSNVSDALEIVDISDPANPVHKGYLLDGAGSAPYLNNPYSVFVSGNYAYVASGSSNALEIIDVSDPTAPVHKGSLTNSTGGALLGQPMSIYVSGNYAYLGSTTSNALEIVDISNPSSPIHKGSITQAGGATAMVYPTSVFISGNYAYIGTTYGDGALEIIDISGANISNAEIGTAKVSNMQIMNNALFDQSVNIKGGLSVGSNGLLISGDFGMSTPTSTSITTATNTLSFSHTALFKSIAATTETNLFVFDTVNTITSGDLLTIRNNGTTRLSLDESGNLGINSSTPMYGLSLEGASYFSATSTLASGLIVDNGVLFVDPASNRVGINSTTPAYSLSILGTMYISSDSILANATSTNFYSSATLSSNLLTVTATSTLASTTITNLNVDSGTLYVDNINNRVGINSSTPMYDLSVSGMSYFAGTSTMANYLNVEGKVGNPVHKSALAGGNAVTPYLNAPFSVFIQGDYAYVTARGNNTVEIADISNPATPAHLSSISNGTGGALLSAPQSIVVFGNYAYVASYGSNALEILDISNPATPAHKGSIINGAGGALLTSPESVAVSGNYAYVVSSGSDALEIIDISDPANPVHKGSIADGGGSVPYLKDPASIDVSGKYAYITSIDKDSLEIIDISDPANPVHTGSIIDGVGEAPYLVNPTSVKVSGKYAYLTSYGSDAIEIIDISNPATPTHKGSLIDGGSSAPYLSNAYSIAVSGKYAYVVSYLDSAVEVIDVSNPASPTHKGSIVSGAGGALLSNPYSIFVSGNYAYIGSSSGFGSLEILDISGANISNAEIGTAKVSNMQIMNNALFDQSVNIKGGLSVGSNGLLISGDIGMSSPTSTHITTATNTLNFSHTALFKSSATTTETNLFIFDTANSFTTAASTTYLFSVRNNGASKFSVASDGSVTANGQFFAASATVGAPFTPGDLAEKVDISPDEIVEPGDVMVVDFGATDTYRRSSSPYDSKVAGVVSTNPTIVIGEAKTSFTTIMAMVGRVPVKASAENGPIERGDLLVTASSTGYAMRYNTGQDDLGRVVGVIGVALDPLPVGKGKIMSLVRTGWVQNRNQSIETMQENIYSLAAASNVSIQPSPQELTIAQNSDGFISYITGQNFNLNNSLIINVAGIAGSDNKWQIDNEGRFITKVAGANGNSKSLYAMQSEQTEMILSGSSALENGQKKIAFDETNSAIINPEKDIKVSITLTSEANGVFVAEKSKNGFTVKELGGGTSSASFDWVVIAERIAGGENEIIDIETTRSVPSGDVVTTTENNSSVTSTPDYSISSYSSDAPVASHEQTNPATESLSNDPSLKNSTVPEQPNGEVGTQSDIANILPMVEPLPVPVATVRETELPATASKPSPLATESESSTEPTNATEQ